MGQLAGIQQSLEHIGARAIDQYHYTTVVSLHRVGNHATIKPPTQDVPMQTTASTGITPSCKEAVEGLETAHYVTMFGGLNERRHYG
jgi:hypothetical protein